MLGLFWTRKGQSSLDLSYSRFWSAAWGSIRRLSAKRPSPPRSSGRTEGAEGGRRIGPAPIRPGLGQGARAGLRRSGPSNPALPSARFQLPPSRPPVAFGERLDHPTRRTAQRPPLDLFDLRSGPSCGVSIRRLSAKRPRKPVPPSAQDLVLTRIGPAPIRPGPEQETHVQTYGAAALESPRSLRPGFRLPPSRPSHSAAARHPTRRTRASRPPL